MFDYQTTLKFKTKDSQTGNEIMKALIGLINNNSVEDLKALARFSKEKPGWVQKAMKYKSYL